MDLQVEVNSSIAVKNYTSAIEKQDKLTQLIVSVNFIFFLVGVPGNALILAVNRRRAVKTGTRVFMSALAATDLCLCSLRPFETAYILFDGKLSLSNKPKCVEAIVTVIITLDMGLIQSSAFSAVVIAFNRCHAVCHPHSRRISPRKAVLMSVACKVTAFLIELVCLIIVVNNNEDNSKNLAYSELIRITTYIASMFLVVCFYGKILCFLRGRGKIFVQPKVGGNDQQPKISTLTGGVGTRNACITNESQHTDFKGTVSKGTPTLSDLTPNECAEKQPSNNGQLFEDVSPSRQNSEEASPRPNLVNKTSRLPVEKHLKRPQVRPKKISNKITTNLLLVTASFFVLSLPFILLNMSTIIREMLTSFRENDQDENCNKLINPKWITMWHLVFLKSVLNPFIYGLVDARFRAECRALLRRLKCCHRNP